MIFDFKFVFIVIKKFIFFENFINKLTNLYVFLEKIFLFLQQNLAQPLKESFRIFYFVSDFCIILMTFGLLCSFVLIILEVYKEKTCNCTYFIEIRQLHKKLKQKNYFFFQFLINNMKEILKSGNNPVVIKTIKFVFAIVLILILVGLVEIDFFLGASILFFWLILFINRSN